MTVVFAASRNEANPPQVLQFPAFVHRQTIKVPRARHFFREYMAALHIIWIKNNIRPTIIDQKKDVRIMTVQNQRPRGANRPLHGHVFSYQSGLSLVELLVALAITALISAVFLQAMQGLTRSATRSASAADRAVATGLSQSQFSRVVAGITPQWPDRDDGRFVGDRSGFSALTRAPLDEEQSAFKQITMALVPKDAGTTLIYRSKDVAWTVTDFRDGSVRFDYLAADGTWYDVWPPSAPPNLTTFEEDARFLQVPSLPSAIRVRAQTGRQSKAWGSSGWIAAVGSSPYLQPREEDVFGAEL